MKSDLSCGYRCPYDGLPCSRFIDDMGFGACYVKDLAGKLRSVCSRFVVKSDVSISEDLVHKKLIPK
jgi:hypothetical protein